MNARTAFSAIASLLIFAGSARVDARDVTVNASGAAAGCQEVDFRIGGGVPQRAEERLEVGGNALALRAGSVPVNVVGSDRNGSTLQLCKAAATRELLDSIRLEQHNGTVSVAVPDSGDWAAYLIVQVPRSAQLDVETTNGPLSLSDISGQVRARAKNGPLTLKRVAGEVDASAENGPISFKGGSGAVRLTTHNGPLSIKVENESWEGGELRASAENGPMSLRLPPGFVSGVVLEREGNGPLRCPPSLCGERSAEDEMTQRRIEIGRGTPLIHLRSGNGPVQIKEGTTE